VPERGFDTAFWDDPFVMKLPKDGKLLYAYLWTNPHCNPAGLYEIALETIAFETKLAIEDIPALLEALKPKVIWYAKEDLVWVKNFVIRQTKSSQFLKGVARSLTSIHHDTAVQELLNYNLKRPTPYGEIPYKYYMDRISTPADVEGETPLQNPQSKEPSSKTKDILDPKLGAIAKCFEEKRIDGGILTPTKFERLKIIADTCSEGLFEKAVEEACAYNHRNLGYIEKILERWNKEGFGSSRTKGKGYDYRDDPRDIAFQNKLGLRLRKANSEMLKEQGRDLTMDERLAIKKEVAEEMGMEFEE